MYCGQTIPDNLNVDFLRGYTEGYKTAMLEIKEMCEFKYEVGNQTESTATVSTKEG